MKKKMKKFTSVVAPVLAMSMALTACSGSSGGEKKTTTTSNNGGEEKKSDIKYAAKQVLNRTETNEIPT
ncbi:peptide ABC transporter substrate-binding protein, partial [Acinetobacter baumannii]|nr:peptide ABC transporter substrate-binding protein [Acinetobacter baumannii]